MFEMVVSAALAVTQIVPPADLSQEPRLLNPRMVLSTDDYPEASIRRNEQGYVTTLVRITKEGRVTGCKVTESSGFADLDRASCARFVKRARFEPAKNAAGSPIDAEYPYANRWTLADMMPATGIQLGLKVAPLPRGYHAPVKAALSFDQTGRVTTCKVMETSGSAAADAFVCRYAKQQLIIGQVRSASPDIPPLAVRVLTANLSASDTGPSEIK